MKQILLILSFFTLTLGGTFAQQRSILGKITDGKDLSLIHI
jgi:hypothetical protein